MNIIIKKHFTKDRLTKYWNDKVWSTVIATAIVTISGSILTSIYFIFEKLISKIPFHDTYDSISIYFTHEITITRIWFIITILLVLIILFKPIFNFSKALIKKLRELGNKKRIAQKELPIAHNISTAMFYERMASAFPGIRDVTWFNDPKLARKRLEILLREPLIYKSRNGTGESNPFWWFRNTSSMFIENFKSLRGNKVIMNNSELKIKRIAAFHSNSYYSDFVYVETVGEKQIGIYDQPIESINNCKKQIGYCYEEYGLIDYFRFWKKAISRSDHDDGATIIHGKVNHKIKSKLRVRYLTDYNFIITACDSPYNSRKFENESKEYFDGILTGTKDPKDFFDRLKTYHKNEQ